jgi:hypothetical protein
VANAVLYTTVANVAAIPVSPANNTAIEVTNSTGIESFTPLSGLPAGFVGSSGLSVRIIYQTVGSTWTWIQYFPNDPENRYFKLSGGTITGPITVPQGTVSSPGVKFSGTGNDNTGVYSPGIDELGLVTNGTARLTIDSAGAVAIPGTLGVTGAITGSLTGAASSNVLKAGDTMTGALVHPLGAAATPSITFTGDTNTGIYSSGADQVAISTNGSGRLYVDASGNVGINKFALSQTFHVLSASGGTTARFENSSSGNFIDFFETGGGTRMGYIGHTSATGMAVHNDKNGPIVFDTNNTERMRLDSSGRLGLGTSSPTSTLHVGDGSIASTQSPRVYFSSENGADSVACEIRQGRFNKDVLVVSCNQSLSANLFNAIENGTSRFVITGAGRVGIGATPNADSRLHVKSGANDGNPVLRLEAATNNFLNFRQTGSVYDIHVTANDPLSFTIGASERARIDSSGRLLVGTSSTDVSYYDATTYTPHFQFKGSAASSSSMSLTRTDGSGPVMWFQAGASGQVPGINTFVGGFAFSGYDGAGYRNAARIEAFTDAATGSGDMPGRLVFSTTADGASSPTERLRIAQNGAWGLAGANYGSSGQVLTSNGSGSAPTWQTSSGGITRATDVASTSGTSIDFTSIPSGVKRITVMFNGVSTNGTSSLQIQVGAGSVTTSGYSSVSSATGGGTGITPTAVVTSGMVIRNETGAGGVLSGIIHLTNITGNTWVSSHTFCDTGTARVGMGGGKIALSGTLDRVRITTINGTDTFDAGSINILYES